MKKIFCLLLTICSMQLSAQIVEAQYPGGIDSMYIFVGKNLNFTNDDAYDGTMQVRLLLSKTGTLAKVTIEQSIDTLLDKKIIDIFNSMPAWIPATRDGEAVASTFVLPFYFSYPETIAPYATLHKQVCAMVNDNMLSVLQTSTEIKSGVSETNFIFKDGKIVRLNQEKTYSTSKLKDIANEIEKSKDEAEKEKKIKELKRKTDFNNYYNPELDNTKRVLNPFFSDVNLVDTGYTDSIRFTLTVKVVNKSGAKLGDDFPIYMSDSIGYDMSNDTIDGVYFTLKQNALFSGGEEDLIYFISNNMRYPAYCAEKGIQGKVIMRMSIHKNGKIGKIEPMNDIDHRLQAEALRVLTLLGDYYYFIPQFVNGNVVNSYFVMPLSFRLKKN